MDLAERAERVSELEDKYYNATITGFERITDELWKIRVRPDVEREAHKAGQYYMLALGYWHPRCDGLIEADIDIRFDRLIKRAYSISTPFVDVEKNLVDTNDGDDFEFYIALAHPDSGLASLTPRLATCDIGSRLFMAKRATGRYTLDSVTDPDANCVFISTGTGEAPHMSMVSQLLRTGHTGRILSVVTARTFAELAYRDVNHIVEEHWDNYRYLELVTREISVPKQYVQDAFRDGTLEQYLGAEISADNTHVFLCGNPAMIGVSHIPGVWPTPTGMCELLDERGFTIDVRGRSPNVHLEEYWG